MRPLYQYFAHSIINSTLPRREWKKYFTQEINWKRCWLYVTREENERSTHFTFYACLWFKLFLYVVLHFSSFYFGLKQLRNMSQKLFQTTDSNHCMVPDWIHAYTRCCKKSEKNIDFFPLPSPSGFSFIFTHEEKKLTEHMFKHSPRSIHHELLSSKNYKYIDSRIPVRYW